MGHRELHTYQRPEAASLASATATSPAPGRTMRTWQKIFAQKIADMHVKEPWTLQEDDSLQVHSPKHGRREYLQNHAAGR